MTKLLLFLVRSLSVVRVIVWPAVMIGGILTLFFSSGIYRRSPSASTTIISFYLSHKIKTYLNASARLTLYVSWCSHRVSLFLSLAHTHHTSDFIARNTIDAKSIRVYCVIWYCDRTVSNTSVQNGHAQYTTATLTLPTRLECFQCEIWNNQDFLMKSHVAAAPAFRK